MPRKAFKDPSSGVAYVGDLMFRGHPEENLDEFTANAKSALGKRNGTQTQTLAVGRGDFDVVYIISPSMLNFGKALFLQQSWYNLWPSKMSFQEKWLNTADIYNIPSVVILVSVGPSP